MAKKIKFQSVVLDHSNPLGSGHYGNTYQAHCDQLLCAGKLMTPELFESDHERGWGGRGGRGKGQGQIKRSLVTSFMHEIDNICWISHPHLVQYLGSHIKADTQLPILIMELCQENLTSFLDKSHGSLFYHKEVSLLHDIALALVFLHAHRIVHGNLSSNNVFIVPYAVPLAKISDYGISRMPTIAKQSSSYYGGNPAYLPPDPLTCLQQNAAKVDCYSWGVLATQVLTRQLPLPPPKSEQAEATFTIGEHHKTTLTLVDSTHPLLPIIKSALRLLEGHRPPIDTISLSLTQLKAGKEFFKSFEREKKAPSELSLLGKELGEKKMEVERLTKELSEKTQQIVRMEKQKENAIERPKLQLAETREWKGARERREDGEMSTLEKRADDGGKSTSERSMRGQRGISGHGLSIEGDGINTLGKTAREGRGLEAAGAHVEVIPAQKEGREEVDRPGPLASKGYTKKRKWSLLWRSSTLPEMQASSSSHTLSLTVRAGTSTLVAMARGYSAVGKSGKAYFTPFSPSDKTIYTCQLHKQSTNLGWLTLPECPHFEFGLVIINDAVTAIGGYQQEFRPSQPTNSLLTFSEEKRKWVEQFPPMHTKRRLPAVATTSSLLMVAGGSGVYSYILMTVEVMDLQTQHWSTAEQLPVPMTHASATVCGDYVHIAGGQSTEGPTQVHFRSQLKRSPRGSGTERLSAWKQSYKTPTLWCTLATFGGHLLAVGGQDERKNCSSAIVMYDANFDTWKKVGTMHHKRSACLVAVPGGASGSVMVVVGGFTRKNEITNAAEVIVANL